MGMLDKVTGDLFGGDELNAGYADAAQVQKQMYKRGRKDLSPYRKFGQNYLSGVSDFMSEDRSFDPNELTSTPGYKFRLGEGTKALENSAIARGGLLSGNALRSINEYGQDFASNEYDKEYSRRENSSQNEFSRLMGLVNLGYGAAGGSAGLSQNYGNSMANLYAQRGQSQAEMAQFPFKIAAAAYGAKQ